MGEEDFNEEKILSPEDIIKGLQLKVDKAIAEVINLPREVAKAFAELKRRAEMKDYYYEAIFRLGKPSTRQVLSVLRESGGSHKFTEILRIVDYSPTTLTNALEELQEAGLVRKVEDRYQAVSPAWFFQKKLELEKLRFTPEKWSKQA